jgi:hypothetical protein
LDYVQSSQTSSKENKVPRVRKTVDEWNIQGYYACGWEDLTCETTAKQARARIKEYRENQPGQYRLVKRRVKIQTPE